MSEHHPDMDMIMALASGDLPPDEAARVEAGLDSRARAELAAQRTALTALAGLPRPVLSRRERVRLRAALRRELDGRVTHRRRRPVRALPALAATASLVAVAALAVNLAGGPSFEEERTVTADAPPVAAAPSTMAAPAAALVAEAQAAMEETAMEAAAAESGGDGADLGRAITTTTASMAMAAVMEEEAAEAAGAPESTGRMPELAFSLRTDRPADDLLREQGIIPAPAGGAFPVGELAERAAAAGLRCWESAAHGTGPGAEVYFMGYGLIDGEEGEAYLIEGGPAPSGDSNREEPAAGDDVGYGGILRLFIYPDCRSIDFAAP